MSQSLFHYFFPSLNQSFLLLCSPVVKLPSQHSLLSPMWVWRGTGSWKHVAKAHEISWACFRGVLDGEWKMPQVSPSTQLPLGDSCVKRRICLVWGYVLFSIQFNYFMVETLSTFLLYNIEKYYHTVVKKNHFHFQGCQWHCGRDRVNISIYTRAQKAQNTHWSWHVWTPSGNPLPITPVPRERIFFDCSLFLVPWVP